MNTRRLSGLVLLVTLWVGGCASARMKATPLYTGEYVKTEGPAEKRVNLWPILYYRDPALSVLWPIAERTDDHVAFRPLLSVYKLDKEKHEWNIVPPVAEFDFDTGDHRIFPFFWGDDYFVGFPLAWWFDDVRGVFPVFWWEDAYAMFPLFWYEKDEHCHFFPLWLHDQRTDGHDTWALWPVLRLKRRGDEEGFHVWPLWGTHRDDEDTYRFALWPFCHSWKDEDSSLLITPLWSARRKADRTWSLLFPAYYHSVNESRGSEVLLTPVLGRTKSGDESRWYLMPLATSAAWGEGEKDVWALAPLAHFRWGGDEVFNHVFPLWYYNRNRRLFLSPLFSRKKRGDGGFWNALIVGANYSRSDSGRTFRLLPPIASASWGGYRRGFELFPLFEWEDVRTREDESSASFSTTSLIHFQKGVGTDVYGSPDGTPWIGCWRRNGCAPLWEYETHVDPEADRRYTDFSLLSLLFDYRLREGRPIEGNEFRSEDYVRSRILWRIMHYERLDGDKTLDVFPAVTWDSKADGYRQISFLWRLFRYERTAEGGRNMDLLFLPVQRSKGKTGND